MADAGISSSLTNHERLIDATSLVDVAIGYPEITEPQWLYDLILRPDIQDMEFAYGHRKMFSAEQTEKLHRELLGLVCQSLEISEQHVENGFVIHTGSYALERTLLAVLNEGDGVITGNPSIDIVSGMLLEQKGVHVRRFLCDSNLKPHMADIEKQLDQRTRAIIITSPENPSGALFTEEQVRSLIEVAISRDITLIFDQCFAKINPFHKHIPIICNYAIDKLKWILCWDTGKTFGLKGDKLAFVFCSKNVHRQLRQRFNIIRFDVSRRLEILYTRLLKTAMEKNYYEYVSCLVRENIYAVETFIATERLPIRPLRPDAGGLMLLDISDIYEGVDDHTIAKALLEQKGLGVIHGSDFFYADQFGTKPPKHNHFIRLAVARDRDIIDLTMQHIRDLCKTLHC